MTRSGTDASVVFQLKVTLIGIRPPIWRRLMVPGRIRLSDLHYVIQKAMGWYDCHLHLFEKNRREWSRPEWNELGEFGFQDENKFRLDELLHVPGDSLVYVYDYGDDWRHRVRLEKAVAGPGTSTTPIYLHGRQTATPAGRCGRRPRLL
ncbi:MAG: plasmid pRiA4b ORF-3 family protein [Bryobacteraceae bacterium]